MRRLYRTEILEMKLSEIFDSKVKFRNPKTGRINIGEIHAIYKDYVKIVSLKGLLHRVEWINLYRY